MLDRSPKRQSPLTRPSSLLLVAISLSIGWGIRGNFGHEAGAMIAGGLSALAVALLSERDDWQRRAAYFGLFGALGFGFGGSISYMYPLSFTESGQTASTYYGFFAVFLEGGLWCGLGAAGMALAATMPSDRMTRMFRPLLFVLAAMGLRHWIEAPLEGFLTLTGDAGDDTWRRHESPLYWFDADWLPAVMALAGVGLFDLVDRARQPRQGRLEHPAMLAPFVAACAAAGWAVQRLGGEPLEQAVRGALVVRLGDLNYVNPETGNRFQEQQLLTNWPQFFGDYPQHLGWGLGLFAGVVAYFLLTGRFRHDASLFLYLSLGWIGAFLLLPVLGSIWLIDYGGLRVMPPRSDDWAGILGVFVAGAVWAVRHQLRPVAHVMSVAFVLGGIAFASVPMLRYLLRYPGHPWRFPDGVPEHLGHYQSANWHSILEQMHGFGLGLAVAVAMAMLWKRSPATSTQPIRERWTLIFSVAFLWFGVGYLNLHKLVGTWVEKQSIPATLKAPLLDWFELTPLNWFRIAWWTAAAVCVGLMISHQRRRLEIVPASWIGKGQLVYVLFLWMMVIGNLMRAIPGFSDNRMVTEWVLFMNASLATALIIGLPGRPLPESAWQRRLAWPSLASTWAVGLLAASALMCIYAWATLTIYQKDLEGKPWANHKRFGPDAVWRTKPILKQGEHP